MRVKNQSSSEAKPVNRPSGHHFSIPLDPGGDFVSEAELASSAWEVGRRIVSDRIRKLTARHLPERYIIDPRDGDEPAEGSFADDLLDLFDSAWWEAHGDHTDDWAIDLLGEPSGFEPFEHATFLHHLRPRGIGTTRVDAEEEARLFGWAR